MTGDRSTNEPTRPALQSALDLLVAMTDASVGAIVLRNGVTARAPDDLPTGTGLEALAAALKAATSPLAIAVRSGPPVLLGALGDVPLPDALRIELSARRIDEIALTAFGPADAEDGILLLGWRPGEPDTASPLPRSTSARPNDATAAHRIPRRAVDAIAEIAGSSLSNVRLRTELVARAEAERVLARRLDTLDELTRIGEGASTFEELAARTVARVSDVLGAEGVQYGVLHPDGRFESAAMVGVTDAFATLHRTDPALLLGHGELVEDGQPTIRRFDRALVGDLTMRAAEAAGYAAFAAIPVHVEGRLSAALMCVFDRPPDQLRLDPAVLDSVARIASIALTNFRRRERLVASEARYRTLFEESPEPLLLAMRDGTITDANEASVRLFGDDEAWLVNRSLGDVIEWEPDLRDERMRQLSAMGRLTFRGLGRQSGGGRFPYEVVVHRVDVGGEPRLLLLIRDLTDEQRLQQELVQAQKMEAIGMLVSGVAHELNNPLTAIVAFSQLLHTDPRLPGDLRDNAELLEEAADRTKRIVQNLLDFARQRPPERHATRIDVLVRNVLDLQSYSLGAGGIAVDVDIPIGLPVVELDRPQMQQVLLNLLQNAIQSIGSSRASGQIRISARPRLRHDGEEVVWLSVADNGPGVPPELRERLFLPFFTTKEPGKGTGLGLSVSFGIVAAHDGHLWFEAPAEGGARFVIELPLRAAPEPARREPAHAVQGVTAGRRDAIDPWPSVPAAPPLGYRANAQPVAAAGAAATPTTGGAATFAAATVKPASAEPGGRGDEATVEPNVASGDRPRVLVLDDEPAIRMLLEKTLRNAGWEPIVVSEGQQAVAAIDEHPIDVFLVDHRMAGMSGTDVYEAIATRRPDLAGRFIFMSGDVLNPELQDFVDTHKVGLLAKPFDLATVRGAVRDLLRQIDEGRPG